MAFDFRQFSEEQLSELEEERKNYIPKMFIETINHNEIFTELRFVHGYMHIGYLLVNGEDNIQFELNVTKIDGEYYERSIHLAFISVAPEERKKGIANKHMKILTELADRYGYDMDLEIDLKFGTDKEVLSKFYSSHGFITNDEDDFIMHRPVKK